MTREDELSVQLVTLVIREIYGFNFEDYCQASFCRRLAKFQQEQGFKTLADMIPDLIHDPESFEALMRDLSVTVTEMFRDPHFYLALQDKVIPTLKTYPFVKIWHAGCATGEEVYSMAVLLDQVNYLSRSMLYGTDFNPHAVAHAKKGIFNIKKMAAYEGNFQKSGGVGSLDQYFTSKYNAMKVIDRISDRTTFSQHDLVTDQSFGEMEVILCRNVMIYFENKLRDRVIKLFYDSLVPQGYLCLGDKESLSTSNYKDLFDCVDSKAAIYRKKC